jgi:hypothetical protein
MVNANGRVAEGEQQIFWKAISTASAATFFACGLQAATLVPLANSPGGQSAETLVQQRWQWVYSFDIAVDGGDPIFDGLASSRRFAKSIVCNGERRASRGC